MSKYAQNNLTLQKFKDIGISRISFGKLTDRTRVKANVF